MAKIKWLGSVLNFLVPGLGNIYARKIRKGIVTFILFFLVVLSMRFIAYNFILFVISLSMIVAYYSYLIISGYRDVEWNKIYEPARFDKWYVYVLVIVGYMVIVGSITGRTLDRLTPINFASIPSPAMDPALLVGDVLAYEKTSSIKRNDVTIFWYPDDVRIMYVKRCIGLPGDSLQIEGSTVLVNGKPLTDIPLKFAHTVTTDGARINSRFLEKHQLSDNDYVQIAPDSYRFFLTGDQAINLSKLSLFKKIERSIAPEGETERMIYPSSSGHRWNADYYGPIYIPKKGDRIELTDENIDLYQKCIEFENESVRRVGTGLTINGQPRTTYEFKENYFFMMGDNRHNSLDSRYWGLLPHRLVVGKSMYIYWGHTRDRIGKEII